MAAWATYLENKEAGEDGPFAAFERFDTNKSGALDKAQLKEFMSDLNDGEPVDDSDVDWLVQKADVSESGDIHRLEILAATSYWIDLIVQRRISARKAKSKACVLL